jgi:predicted phosphodiesterase
LRVLIVADIHANLEAFQAVLEDAGRRGGFDEIWCLGDVVGYGPDPGACIELLREHQHICVAGNHDQAAIGRLGLEDFNPHAAAAARWTARQLEPHQVEYLASLPEVVRRGEFTLVHGTLRHPIWEYLLSFEEARATFHLLSTTLCLVGHSHIPFLCREASPLQCAFLPFPEGEPLEIGGERWIVNPGGVGQPRDGDPRPSYILYLAEEGTVTRYRTTYDIGATQEKMRRAGLPPSLIQRLAYGM